MEEVVRMLEEIGSPEQVLTYLEKKLAAKQKLMGFGHRIYKVEDPRGTILQKVARELAEEVERVGEELLHAKGTHPNVDFYSGVLFRTMGIDPDFFPTIFAMARVSGWLSHCLEPLKDNKLFRPDQIYEGPHDRVYVPIDRRLGGL